MWVSIFGPRVRLVVGFWKRYKKNRAAVLGLAVLVILIFLSVIAHWIAPYPPLLTGVAPPLLPPSAKYLMGTDDLGRDNFSAVLFGTRTSLLIGVLTVAISSIIGVLVGASSGYAGGIVDDILMRITEIFLVIPRLLLALVFVSFFGSSIYNVIIVVAMLSWPPTARLLRAEFLSMKEREFVEAAKGIGLKSRAIVMGEILPNCMTPVIVTASMMIASAILIESGLSFLGLSDPNMPSLGYLLNNAQKYIRKAYWLAVFPGLAILITTLSLNLVGDGLSDALNPRLKER